VAKVNLPLSEGKEDWLEEGLLAPAKKKNKRGRIIGEGSSTAQEGGAQHHLEGYRRRQVATVVYQCKQGGVV
jgi:hypothetical protein